MKSNFIKCLLIIISFSAFSFKAIDEGDVYYKLSLDKIFKQTEEVKNLERLSELMPEMQIVKINYSDNTIVVKVRKETVYDNIKQSFDKIGIRVTKEILSVKLPD